MEIEKRNPKIFIISGKARHGKDTTAMYMNEIYTKKGKKILNISYASYIKEYAKKISNWDGSDETKPRELLQQLGTTVIRQNIDEDFWVKSLWAVVGNWNNVIIADVRFPNEVNSIKERGGIIIRLNRDKSRIDYHISETALDDYKEWDLVIDNNSTKEDLFNTLKKIVQKYPLK